MTLRIDELCTVAALEAIEDEWSDLFDRCPAATPFQRPEWVLAWSRSYAPSGIWVLAAREDGRLVGLAPWVRYERQGVRVVGFLAGGVSDYHDVLVDPSAAGAWDAIVGHLARRRATWDECYFEQLRRGSFLRDAPMSPGWSDERTTQELCLRVAVPPAGQPLGAAIPAHQLARLRKYRRRADKWGTMTFEAASELARAPLRDLFTLYEKRWAVKPSTSDAASPDLKFLQDDALLSPRDLAFAPEIHWIHLDGSPLAGLYALRSRSVLHCYLQAFDPSFADVSPGTLLVGSVLEHAHERGITAVDFLRGAEPYKARWGARGETNMARRIRPSGDGANARHRGPADGACFE